MPRARYRRSLCKTSPPHENVHRGFHFESVSRNRHLGALLAAFALCAWLAAGDASNMPFARIFSIRIKLQNFLVLIAMLLVWAGILAQMGLYRTYIYGSRSVEVRDLAIGMSLCAAALWIVHQVLNIQLIGIEFLTYFWLLSIALGTAGRLTLRLALRRTRRNGRNVRQVLIVGTNPRAVDLMRQVVSAPELGFRLVGFVDERWAGTEAIVDAGYPIVSDFGSFPDFISRNVVDEVMVCLPFKSLYERSSQIIAQCAEQGITARLVSDVVTPRLARSHVEKFANRMVLTVQTGGMRGWSMVDQAFHGHRDRGVGADRSGALDAGRRSAHSSTLTRLRIFHPGAHGCQQASLPALQISHHDSRCGKEARRSGTPERGQRPGIQDSQ